MSAPPTPEAKSVSPPPPDAAPGKKTSGDLSIFGFPLAQKSANDAPAAAAAFPPPPPAAGSKSAVSSSPFGFTAAPKQPPADAANKASPFPPPPPSTDGTNKKAPPAAFPSFAPAPSANKDEQQGAASSAVKSLNLTTSPFPTQAKAAPSLIPGVFGSPPASSTSSGPSSTSAPFSNPSAVFGADPKKTFVSPSVAAATKKEDEGGNGKEEAKKSPPPAATNGFSSFMDAREKESTAPIVPAKMPPSFMPPPSDTKTRPMPKNVVGEQKPASPPADSPPENKQKVPSGGGGFAFLAEGTKSSTPPPAPSSSTFGVPTFQKTADAGGGSKSTTPPPPAFGAGGPAFGPPKAAESKPALAFQSRSTTSPAPSGTPTTSFGLNAATPRDKKKEATAAGDDDNDVAASFTKKGNTTSPTPEPAKVGGFFSSTPAPTTNNAANAFNKQPAPKTVVQPIQLPQMPRDEKSTNSGGAPPPKVAPIAFTTPAQLFLERLKLAQGISKQVEALLVQESIVKKQEEEILPALERRVQEVERQQEENELYLSTISEKYPFPKFYKKVSDTSEDGPELVTIHDGGGGGGGSRSTYGIGGDAPPTPGSVAASAASSGGEREPTASELWKTHGSEMSALIVEHAERLAKIQDWREQQVHGAVKKRNKTQQTKKKDGSSGDTDGR